MFARRVLLMTGLVFVSTAALAGAGAASAAAASTAILSGVSCPSATTCVAVGYTAPGGLGASLALAPLTEVWNGGAWHAASAPHPSRFTGSQLRSVSCVSTTSCVAVGFSMLGNAARTKSMTAFADRWNGRRWTLQKIPKPVGAKFTQLFSVSCTSTTACTAVGSVNAGFSLAVRWNGKVWKRQSTPRPPIRLERLTFLEGVSCSSSTSCVAVGESGSGLAFSHKYNTYRSLAERWNGRRWTIQPTLRPAHANEAFLQGVSCVSTTNCTAVGNALINPARQVALAETWSGVRWAIGSVPADTQAAVPDFGGVSCYAASSCLAVGGATLGDTAAAYSAMSEQETPSGWRVLPLPTPPGYLYLGLSGISCSSSSACTAVGLANKGANRTATPLIERWNGTSWALQAP